jgi:hypothetical protein
MSIARIEDRKYTFICKEKHEIQPKHLENCNDCMRIYIVSTFRIHEQKYNILLEARTCVTYRMKKL